MCGTFNPVPANGLAPNFAQSVNQECRPTLALTLDAIYVARDCRMLQMTQNIPNESTVRIRGRRTPYIGRRQIGSKSYFLLERIGSPLRDRYKAFDPHSGPAGDFMLLSEWENGPQATQFLNVLKQLRDDSFPRVVDFQRHSGGYTCVQTWTDGICLSDYLRNVQTKKRPTIDPAEAVRLIHGLAHGVCRLHQKTGVSHGDIQPANLILTSHPSRLMLIDFGSAWAVQTCAIRTEGDGHHMNYAAPEVWMPKQPAGWHADQFSVSVVLYHLLTGEIPYPGLGRQSDYPNAIAEMQRALKPPSDLSQKCAALPRSLRLQLDSLVCRGLALTPEGRFQDRHKWLNEFFELLAKLRLTPQLPPTQNFLTRVIERILGIWDNRK